MTPANPPLSAVRWCKSAALGVRWPAGTDAGTRAAPDTANAADGAGAVATADPGAAGRAAGAGVRVAAAAPACPRPDAGWWPGIRMVSPRPLASRPRTRGPAPAALAVCMFCAALAVCAALGSRTPGSYVLVFVRRRTSCSAPRTPHPVPGTPYFPHDRVRSGADVETNGRQWGHRGLPVRSPDAPPRPADGGRSPEAGRPERGVRSRRPRSTASSLPRLRDFSVRACGPVRPGAASGGRRRGTRRRRRRWPVRGAGYRAGRTSRRAARGDRKGKARWWGAVPGHRDAR